MKITKSVKFCFLKMLKRNDIFDHKTVFILFRVSACFVVFFEIRFLCISLAILELTLYIGLDSNSEIYLPLPPEY